MTVLVIVSKSVRPLQSYFLDVAWLLPWFECIWPVGSATVRGVALLEGVCHPVGGLVPPSAGEPPPGCLGTCCRTRSSISAGTCR